MVQKDFVEKLRDDLDSKDLEIEKLKAIIGQKNDKVKELQKEIRRLKK